MSSLAVYGKVNTDKLKDMTPEEMIQYDVRKEGKYISVLTYEEGIYTSKTYAKEGQTEEIYDFEIGSLSKTFLGLYYSKLVKENKVVLTDTIDRYLDLEPGKYYPTIERLLTHTSGYKPYYFEGEMIKTRFSKVTKNDFYRISKDQILSKVRSVSLEDKDYPFSYSNFGISVLGLVMESIEKEDYTTIMNDFIHDELRLSDRTKVASSTGNLSSYWKWNPQDGYIPAGSIISNIEDMKLYLDYYLKQKPYSMESTSLLKEVEVRNASYDAMGIEIDAVGMTWMKDKTHSFTWHNGGTSDFNSYLAFREDRTKAILLLSNLGPNQDIPTTVIGARWMEEK